MYCPMCGKPVKDGSRFCGSCGAALRQPNEAGAEAAPVRVSVVQPSNPVQQASRQHHGIFGRFSRRTIVAVGSIIALAILLIVAVALFVFLQGVAIDEKTFPNAIIREAVAEQLDEDGNGRLVPDEASHVTGLVYTTHGAKFMLDATLDEVDAERESVPETYTGTAPTALDGLGHFPNLNALIANDADLGTVDLASVPTLEHADLRNNGIEEMDLGRNTNLKSLLCDSNVTTLNLEGAGLYYSDMISAYKSDNGYREGAMEYDLRGRLTHWSEYDADYDFSYDTADRLVSVSIDSVWNDETGQNTYSYGANGLLSEWEENKSVLSGYDIEPEKYYLRYDPAGRLTEVGSTSDGSNSASGGSFTYESNGKMVAYRGSEDGRDGTEISVQFIQGDDGRVESFFLCEDPKQSRYWSQDRCAYKYTDEGRLLSSTISTVQGGGASYDGKKQFANSYDGAGRLDRSMFEMGGETYVLTYSYDGSGSPSRIEESSSYYSQVFDIDYVRFVGSYSDRENRRFLPAVRPHMEAGQYLYDYHEPWEAVSPKTRVYGEYMPLLFALEGPETATGRALGYCPPTIASANDAVLNEYDREHWSEWVIKGAEETSIEDSKIRSIIQQTSSMPLSMVPEGFLDDEVYGGIVREYVELGQKATEKGSLTEYDMRNAGDGGAVLSAELLDSLAVGRSFGTTSQYFAFAFAFVDLNGDGKRELLVRDPWTYTDSANFGALYIDDSGASDLVLSSAYRLHCRLNGDGSIMMSASGGAFDNQYTVYRLEGDDIVEVASLTSVSEYAGIGAQPTRQEVRIVTEDGGDEEMVVSQSEASRIYDEFMALYSPAEIMWTCIVSTKE